MSAELDAELVAIQVCGTCICNYLSHDPDEYGHHGYCPIDQQRKVKEFLLSPQSPYEALRRENARLREALEKIWHYEGHPFGSPHATLAGIYRIATTALTETHGEGE